MADVVGSREKPPKETAIKLSEITAKINQTFKSQIYSPLTVTLGDEFQGVIDSAKTGIALIIASEELLIKNVASFKLRYVLLKGRIDTPINHILAHGMIGRGLTDAREKLNQNKKKAGRFYIQYGKKDELLNKLFILYESIVDDWSLNSYKLISDFLSCDDYKIVAKKNKKTPSLMWKRKKSLKITEYQTLKSIILDNA